LQTAVEVLEDEGLFDEEDEEDAGALAMYVFSYSWVYRCHKLTMILFINSGDFADALGEDYLGLRELGIAAEFGMSSLSIPKKLLRGKKAQNKLSSTACVSPPSLF
jgi:transcriptional activator SPT7